MKKNTDNTLNDNVSKVELIAFKIVKKLQDAGYYKSYFVGGYVRDKLLGIKFDDTIDIDIATEAKSKSIKKVFKGERFIDIGEAFNIIMLIIDGYKFEIATFREDIFETDKTKWDGRHPSNVALATAEEDAKRRDFTVNAIFFDPVKKEHIDFVNGIDDLKKKIIRTIGEPEKRFREDYLRMLRGIRFAVQKDFKIDSEVLNVIKKRAKNIALISKERILIELKKIILSDSPARGLKLLRDTNLLKYMFFYDMVSENSLDYLDYYEDNRNDNCNDNFNDMILYQSISQKNLIIRYAIFFRFYQQLLDDTLTIKNELIKCKFDNKTITSIIWILENRKLLSNWNKLSNYEKMELIIQPNFKNLLIIFEIEAKKDKDKIVLIKDINSYYNNAKSDKKRWNQMKKFTIINGEDLLAMNIRGKKIGFLLKDVKQKYIIGELENREKMIKYIKSVI